MYDLYFILHRWTALDFVLRLVKDLSSSLSVDVTNNEQDI